MGEPLPTPPGRGRITHPAARSARRDASGGPSGATRNAGPLAPSAAYTPAPPPAPIRTPTRLRASQPVHLRKAAAETAAGARRRAADLLCEPRADDSAECHADAHRRDHHEHNVTKVTIGIRGFNRDLFSQGQGFWQANIPFVPTGLFPARQHSTDLDREQAKTARLRRCRFRLPTRSEPSQARRRADVRGGGRARRGLRRTPDDARHRADAAAHGHAERVAFRGCRRRCRRPFRVRRRKLAGLRATRASTLRCRSLSLRWARSTDFYLRTAPSSRPATYRRTLHP